MVYPSQIKVVLIMNALWAWPIKRLYFCPFSCPEIGKLFNDSSLSSTRQTKGSTSSKSSAFARLGGQGGRINEEPPERRAQARIHPQHPRPLVPPAGAPPEEMERILFETYWPCAPSLKNPPGGCTIGVTSPWHPPKQRPRFATSSSSRDSVYQTMNSYYAHALFRSGTLSVTY